MKLTEEYRQQLADMMEEWYDSGEKIVPCAIRRLDYQGFATCLANMQCRNASEGQALLPE